jgi:hypothetical protein
MELRFSGHGEVRPGNPTAPGPGSDKQATADATHCAKRTVQWYCTTVAGGGGHCCRAQ